jgi:hypothetical protein
MNKEDIKFLKDLQHEMLTQDHVYQADPRFWVVIQTVKDYWVNDDIDGTCIYDTDTSENVFEGNISEKLAEWIKEEFDVVISCEYDGHLIHIVCEDECEYHIDDMEDLKEFLDEYDYGNFSLCNYREREEIVPNTMFLTLRECKEHIEKNHYHYVKPHSYAMTAWRSPQVERLYKILQTTDWEKELEGD